MIKIDEYYTKYSEIPLLEKETYYQQIYIFLKWLNFEYPGFRDWYDSLFKKNKELRYGREIIICEKEYSIAGIAILKSTEDEQKICTLRVAKKYQRQGIGKRLMEMSFEWLRNDKPLMTMRGTKQHQFVHLLEYYGFELEQKNKNYYNLFSTELVYNGVLPVKQILFNRIDLLDYDLFYKKYILKDRYEQTLWDNGYIYCKFIQEQIRRFAIVK